MNLPLLFFAVDVATVTCMALLAARLLAGRPRLAAAQLMALIAFDCICHVVAGRQDYRFWIPPGFRLEIGAAAMIVLNLFRNLTAGLFTVLCHRLFADRPRFPRWLFGLFAAQMLLEIPAHWPAPLPADVLLRATPGILQTLFAGMALYWTIASWRGDLIETRRRVRVLTTLIVGLDVFVSGVLTRLLVAPDSIAQYYVHEALVATYLVLAVLVLFQLIGGDLNAYLDPVRVSSATPPAPAEPDPALSRLVALMEGEHLYRKPGLTLKGLAERAGLPEYRLRKIIHEAFGFANFNAFLHAWRIREACGQLRDPALRRTPVLTIALSVGYQSVNTFNRGFRYVLDMSPSEYRALETAPLPPKPEIGAPKTA